MKQNYILIKKQEIRANCKLLMMTDCPVATEPILCKTVFFCHHLSQRAELKL